jgi:hypothetical protein
MELLPISNAQRKAAQIEDIAGQVASFLQSQLGAIHAIALTDPAGILGAFGNQAASSLAAYEVLRTALEQAMPGFSAPPFSAANFTPQANGTVTYTPPAVDPGETFEPLS